MDYIILTAILIINFIISQVGTISGQYSTTSANVTVELAEETPGILGVVDWAFESGSFLFQLATFQIEEVPALVSGIFLIMQLVLVFIILKWIRGS